MRLRGDAPINRGALVKPPEELGAAKGLTPFSRQSTSGLIERFHLQKSIGLLPKTDFARVAPEPAVRYNAMTIDRLTGQESGLGSAGDRGHDLAKRPAPAPFG
jgi:hypothetical protein